MEGQPGDAEHISKQQGNRAREMAKGLRPSLTARVPSPGPQGGRRECTVLQRPVLQPPRALCGPHTSTGGVLFCEELSGTHLACLTPRAPPSARHRSEGQ